MAANQVAPPPGKISDSAVKRATGRTWEQWFAALDGAGAAQMEHKQIVELVAGEHAVPAWWQQMVSVTYEQARGLRQPHQKSDGYEIAASKVVNVPLEKLYRAWTAPELRDLWLPEGQEFTVRRATPERSVHITWIDGRSSVDATFSEKSRSKSQVALNHGRLSDSAEASRMKEFWVERLARLKQLLEN